MRKWNVLSVFFALCLVGPRVQAQQPTSAAPAEIRISERVKLTPSQGFRYAPPAMKGLTELVQEQNGKLTARVMITTEERGDHATAVHRLLEIAKEAGGKRTFTQICGWPALERVYRVRLAHPELDSGLVDMHKPFPEKEADVEAVTIAVAESDAVVRFEGTLEPGAPPAITAQILEIGRSISCSPNLHPERTTPEINKLKQELMRNPAGALNPNPGRTAPSESRSLAPAAPSSTTPQAALVQTGNGELQIAVSQDGNTVVIGANSGTSWSSNTGGSFQGSNVKRQFGSLGDPTVGRGVSSAFYLGLIGFPNALGSPGGVNACTDSVFSSPDGGQNFNWVGNAAVCSATGNGGCFPDQPQMAVDRKNLAGTSDQLYMVWRNFAPPSNANVNWCQSAIQQIPFQGTPVPTISCSSNGGANWTNPVPVGTGDFGRVTVGSDGFVYVTYVIGSNLMLNKFSSCATGLVQQKPVFPITIASVKGTNCPIPGLDRCNPSSDTSPQPAAAEQSHTQPPTGIADDLYVAYAEATGSANDDIVVRASHDGGKTWPDRAVVNGNAPGRRFLPWVCASSDGPAQVTWYDRRSATSMQNDLTAYFFNQVSPSPNGLIVGNELNVSVSADRQCATGFPLSFDNINDATTCVPPPNNLPGICLNPNPAIPSSGNACNLLSPPNPPVCPANENCTTLGNGAPKYGDYNGNACAAGRVYMAWASATAPPWINPAPAGISIYSDVIPRPAPTVTGVMPNTTPFGTDAWVTITGTNFVGVQSVFPSDNNFTILSSTRIRAHIPNTLPSGSYVIQVTTASGSSSQSVKFFVTPIITGVSPTSGPFTGGTQVTVSGLGFAVPSFGNFIDTKLTIQGVALGSGLCSSTSCNFFTPGGNPGLAEITACVNDACTANDQFTYTGPTVSGLSPADGPITGGTWVSITGTGLTHGSTQIFFDNIQALQWDGCPPTFSSDTCIRAQSPKHAAGQVPVTTQYLTSPRVPAGTFTYDPDAKITSIGYDPSRAGDLPGWIILNGFAPPEGAPVSLTSSDLSAIPKQQASVSGGAWAGTFRLTFLPIPRTETVTVTASYAGSSASTTVTAYAWPPITLNLGATQLAAGAQTQGTVTVNTPAPAQGANVVLACSDPSAVIFTPSPANIPGNANTGTFTVTGNYSGTPKTVIITATSNGASASTSLDVPTTPPPPPPICPPHPCPRGFAWNPDTCECEPF